MFNLFARKTKPTIANAVPVMGGSMYDFAAAERREFIRRDAGFLPPVLAAKRDISIKRLGTAYQLHRKYDPAKHPNHPRIGIRRTDTIIERHNYRAGVDL